MTNALPRNPIILDDNPEEVEALSRLFDYLAEALKEAGSTRAIHAVEAAKSVMMMEFCGKEIQE